MNNIQHWVLLGAVSTLAFFGGVSALNSASNGFETMEDVWRGYDAEAVPLDIEIIKSWQEDACWLEKLRFTGENVDGTRTRILAVRGGPVGGTNLPGVLHIHGGGQTLYPGWVQYWAKRGYACVTFDFCGKAYDRTEYTDWGPLETCNMPMAGDGYFVKPDVRASSWYHWIVACRRSLSLLQQTQGVDPNRLGIFGISVGGTLCWMVAGCDSRIKAAVPIYGCGYNIDPRRPANEAGPPSEAHLEFRRLLSPEACAPYIKCPVLFLSATNDMHGRMPTAYEILGAVDAPVRQAFTAKYDHHVEPEQAKDLQLWMDWHLKGLAPMPNSPSIEVALDSAGVPVATVSVDSATQVKRVEVYYSLDDKVPGARFWRTVLATRSGGQWRAGLPVMDTWKSLHVFANVFHASGACLSSNLVSAIPGQMGKARATLKWSANISDDADPTAKWYFVPAYVDPCIDSTYLKAGEDASGKSLMLNPDAFGGVVDFYIGSHFPGDEQYEGKPGKALAFEFKGGFDGELTVMIVQNDRLIGGKTFNTTVPASTAKTGWQSVVLPLSAFKAEDGVVPQQWSDIDKVNIAGSAALDQPPCFRGFRWVDDQAGK